MKSTSRILLLVCTVFILACVAAQVDGAVVGAMCGTFIAAVSAYTALDLRTVIQGTVMLPEGQYAVADIPKYALAVTLLGILFIAAIARQYLYQDDMGLALGILGPGIIGVLAIIIAGLKINKAETPKCMVSAKETSRPGKYPNASRADELPIERSQ